MNKKAPPLADTFHHASPATLNWALFMELGFVEVATRQAPRTLDVTPSAFFWTLQHIRDCGLTKLAVKLKKIEK